MKHLVISAIVATVVTAAVYALGFAFGWITTIDPLEAFANWTTYSCTYLCVFQSRNNYWIAVPSIAAFGLLFYNQNLLASAALQAVFIPWMFYGWWRWGSDEDTRPVTRLGADLWTLGYGVIAVVTYGVAYWINTSLGGSLAYLDSGLFVSSIVAQVLMDNKKIENWIVWFLLDVVSVYVYWDQGLKITAVQFAIFTLNAIWGFYEWRKTMKRVIS
jgi:nicotinamide mononucleotide transporter